MRRIFFAAVAASLIACVKSVEPLPLAVTIEANKLTAAVGDSVDFLVKAQGGNLVDVTIDFGDDTSDLFESVGARRSEVHFPHRYNATGVYDVHATVTDVDA